MLLITHTFHMTNASTEVANGLCGVNGDIFGFEVDTWSVVAQQLPFLLSYIGENFGYGRYRIHEKNVGTNISVLFVQASQELHSSILELSLSDNGECIAGASNITRTDGIRPKVLDLIPNYT